MTTPPSINVSELIKDDRQLRSLIGLGRDDFEKLLKEFTACLKEDPRKNRKGCLLYTSPSPRDGLLSRMPSSA